MSLRQIVSLGVRGGLIVIAMVTSFSLFGLLNASELMVIQAPVSGTLT